MHMKQTMKDALAVVLFLLLFPYFAMSFWQQKHEEASSENDSLQQEALELTAQLSEGSYFVYWEKEQKKIPSELFLVGALAGSIDSSCETEALKAQAVMLRSSLYRNIEYHTRNTVCSEQRGSIIPPPERQYDIHRH